MALPIMRARAERCGSYGRCAAVVANLVDPEVEAAAKVSVALTDRAGTGRWIYCDDKSPRKKMIMEEIN